MKYKIRFVGVNENSVVFVVKIGSHHYAMIEPNSVIMFNYSDDFENLIKIFRNEISHIFTVDILMKFKFKIVGQTNEAWFKISFCRFDPYWVDRNHGVVIFREIMRFIGYDGSEIKCMVKMEK